MPQEGGVASGFKHVEAEEHKTRLYVCKGKHVVHVKEARLCSLLHDGSSTFIIILESMGLKGSHFDYIQKGHLLFHLKLWTLLFM